MPVLLQLEFRQVIGKLDVMMRAKEEALLLNTQHICPDRVSTWKVSGIDLVIGKREGYKIQDMDGREFWDLHLNGGTFSFGHRNPDFIRVLENSLQTLDIGNHHFPSPHRAELGKALSESTGNLLPYVVLSPSGSEAADVAVKSARHATGKRKIVSLSKGYHGRSGLSGALGDDEAAGYFLSDDPENNLKVPFEDADAVEKVFRRNDIAAFIMEISPATDGFPIASQGYMEEVARLCAEYGVLFIADEIQTGLARSGRTWAYQTYGIEPDIVLVGKGLSGGLYPMAATLLSDEAGAWLRERGWAHVSTFGGAELGCPLATYVTRLAGKQETLEHVSLLSDFLKDELQELAGHHSYLQEVRQSGLIIGLKFDDPVGGMKIMRALFKRGVWAMYAGFDRSVLQFKPGVFLGLKDAAEIVDRLEDAVVDVKGE